MIDTNYIGDLILLRGLPGSGKSTIGEVMLMTNSIDKPDVLSADDYFMTPEGEYLFNPSKLKEAHNDCQQRCAAKMRNQITKIVVANTFTEEWEMETYFEMAERYRYRVHTVIVENRHGSKNIHNCTEEKVSQMKNRFNIKL
jgi:predicted kinase